MLQFIRSNFVIDKEMFAKATSGSKQRRRILSIIRTAELDPQDSRVNAFLQTYAQSKELKSCYNSYK